MEYIALFVWICLCLMLSWLVHIVGASTERYRVLQFLALPGAAVRRCSMAAAVMLTGGTITRGEAYTLTNRDVEFDSDGPAGIARAVVPLAPLFGGALALTVLNRLAGSPMALSRPAPVFPALDVAGLKVFLSATWALVADSMQGLRVLPWSSPATWVLLLATLTLALGAGQALNHCRNAVVGAGLLVIAMALVAAVASRQGPAGLVEQPAWIVATRAFLLDCTSVAFCLTFYGLLLSLVLGIGVRLVELATGAEAHESEEDSFDVVIESERPRSRRKQKAA
jgi:hypothetical protein